MFKKRLGKTHIKKVVSLVVGPLRSGYPGSGHFLMIE